MRVVFWIMFLIMSSSAQILEINHKNGAKLIIKRTAGPGLVAGTLLIPGGTNGEKNPGETYLLSQLLLKGTAKYSAEEISSTFEDFGGSISISTHEDFIELTFETRTQGLSRALDVIKSMLKEPLLKEDDLVREKKNALEAIASRAESPQTFAMDKLRAFTFRRTSYEYPPIGTPEGISSTTVDRLKQRLSEALNVKGSILAIVGDFEPSDFKDRLLEVLDALNVSQGNISTSELIMTESKQIRLSREGSQSTVVCMFMAPSPKDRDYYPFLVFDSALGSGMSSLLFQELREKRGYAYAVYSFVRSFARASRLLTYIGTSPQNGEKVMSEMIELVKSHSFKEEQVELAKRRLIGLHLLRRQTRRQQSSALAWNEALGAGWRSEEEFQNLISSVDTNAVNSVKEKYTKYYHCILVGP
ncbi:MAG: insulinase family protein [Aquificaceae bacterium]|nr:insulinase family protein [Aquificaceae bacterium]MDW8237106.1 pitrilysin family protein [Aquificaceae bacterium]